MPLPIRAGLITILVLTSGWAQGQGHYQFSVGGGVFDVVRGEPQQMYKLQVALPETDRFLTQVRPVTGCWLTQDDARFCYLGLEKPWRFADRWLLSPGFSAGHYHQGEGKPLGHDLEFGSWLTLDYLLAPSQRLGLEFAHISNGGLGERNPGAEILVLSYRVRF